MRTSSCQYTQSVAGRVQADLINTNPADKIERPKSPKYTARFYVLEQIKTLLEAIKGDRFELIYKMTMLYGFRRSEICGLKWSAVNFEDNTISVMHTIVQTKVEGKLTMIKKDRAKNQSSMRTLPLLPIIKNELLFERQRQKENKSRYKSCYAEKDKEYIFVDELGNLASPQTVSEHFKMLLRIHELPSIRFHDLRHSCASLLLASGVAMKEIQKWLGHSTYATTADIYSHLNYNSKLNVTGVLSGIFGGEVMKDNSQINSYAVDTLQNFFVADKEKVSVEEEQSAETANEFDELRKIKAEMLRLGFENINEYFDYIEFKKIQNVKKQDLEMQ